MAHYCSHGIHHNGLNTEQNRHERYCDRKEKEQDGTGWNGTGRDGTGRDGTGRDGTGRKRDGVKL